MYQQIPTSSTSSATPHRIMTEVQHMSVIKIGPSMLDKLIIYPLEHLSKTEMFYQFYNMASSGLNKVLS